MPKTILPNARQFPRYAGICTFGRYPRLDDASSPVDWAIYGVPYDGGVSYRPGTRFGPRAIREASQYIKTYHMEHDLTITEAFSLCDAGDAPIEPYSCEKTSHAVTEFAESIGDAAKTKLLALGGDHSIALANIRATHNRLGKPASGMPLIHFDAHLDTVDSLWGEKYSHASPFIRAIEEGLIDPKKMISIGIRGPLNTKDDLSYAHDQGITIVSANQWHNLAGHEELDAFLTQIDEPAYISFDIDVADPVYAPGTGTPAIGGLSSVQILEALQLLANPSTGKGIAVAGADIVEVLPDRDPTGMTSLLAAQIAFEILCIDGVSSQKG
ncbi:MAG: agmatinase [Planctomycetota bacterium]|jgi:agmatinase